ncbi:hypothetical protein Tco_0551471 [Tanacetum coccineum]
MLAPSGGGLILYQAYGNLYAMTGRKAHLLEDKQIPSVGVFDEVLFYTLFRAFGRHLEEIHVTWAHLEKKQTRLRTYTNISQDYTLSSWRRLGGGEGTLGGGDIDEFKWRMLVIWVCDQWRMKKWLWWMEFLRVHLGHLVIRLGLEMEALVDAIEVYGG